jgi:hypothetical protein
MTPRLECEFCNLVAVDQVAGIPHCRYHLVEAITLGETENLFTDLGSSSPLPRFGARRKTTAPSPQK